MIQRRMMIAALCGALAAPGCMQAQTSSACSMSSTGTIAAPADVFEALLSDQEKEVVGAADAMPADKFDYAPTAGEFKGVRTFASQIKHLTEANYGFFASWNIPNVKSRADIEKLTGKDEIMKAFRESFTYAHAAMATITANNAFVQMGTGKSTRAGVATHALAHMMDHYGQMVEYLRMNGIVPPASRPGSM